jgi:hypothetical protein
LLVARQRIVSFCRRGVKSADFVFLSVGISYDSESKKIPSSREARDYTAIIRQGTMAPTLAV